jgi:hypothetical protein
VRGDIDTVIRTPNGMIVLQYIGGYGRSASLSYCFLRSFLLDWLSKNLDFHFFDVIRAGAIIAYPLRLIDPNAKWPFTWLKINETG